MSRRVITSENTPSVFDQYAEIKPQFDAIKKKETELKDLVKQKFLADGLGEYESDKYKLTLTKTENTSLKEIMRYDALPPYEGLAAQRPQPL